MACFLLAAKAIKNAGIALKGDLLLTAVPGEIGWNPIDEFPAPKYLSKEYGARFMVEHGAYADYALVAECTSFAGPVWVEAGKAYFKITVFTGLAGYTPYFNRPYEPEKNPNAVFQLSRLILRLEDWALDWQKKNTFVSPGGTCIPRVNLSCVRGGVPYRVDWWADHASLYIDCRTVPNQDPLAIRAEIEEVMRSLQIDGKVELFRFLRGYEAQNIDRLADATRQAHLRVLGKKIEPAIERYSSMWRDLNMFNQLAIPSLTYGPGREADGGVTVDALHKASQIYAMVALDMCMQEKPV